MRRLVVAVFLMSAVGCDLMHNGDPVLIDKPTSPDPLDARFANGVYKGPGKATSNGCPGFSDTATVTGTIQVDQHGQGSWRKIHESAGGLIFEFDIQLQVLSATSASFAATTKRMMGDGYYYDIVDRGTLTTSSALTVTQTFTREGIPCTTEYKLDLRKQ